jgi:hypothetical protein
VKKLFLDILLGFLLFIFIFVVEFSIMLIFGDPAGFEANQFSAVSLEFLLISLPAGILSFLLALLIKTIKQADALRRGIVWAVEILFVYLAIGLLNNTAGVIFSSFGMYLMLVLVFSGPSFARSLRLKKSRVNKDGTV